jgi:hypothetical protein
VGVSLPGAEWLPFLCAIRYGACDQGYQVVSDAEAFALGMMLSNRPAMVSAQPPDGRGKCVGISVVQKPNSPGGHCIFRAFEDGKLEMLDMENSASYGPWKKVGQ